MRAAAALGACARNGSDPSRTIIVASATPVVPRVGASLRFLTATLPLVRQAFRLATQAQRHLPPPPANESGGGATIAVVTRLVQLSSRYAWLVILGFLLAAIACASYFARHVVFTTDKDQLISSSLPWRQQERMIDLAFPQRVDRILVVIDATTPEGADSAADALVNELSPRSDMIRTVSRFDGGEFFERNGILFRILDEVRRD